MQAARGPGACREAGTLLSRRGPLGTLKFRFKRKGDDKYGARKTVSERPEAAPPRRACPGLSSVPRLSAAQAPTERRFPRGESCGVQSWGSGCQSSSSRSRYAALWPGRLMRLGLLCRGTVDAGQRPAPCVSPEHSPASSVLPGAAQTLRPSLLAEPLPVT